MFGGGRFWGVLYVALGKRDALLVYCACRVGSEVNREQYVSIRCRVLIRS